MLVQHQGLLRFSFCPTSKQAGGAQVAGRGHSKTADHTGTPYHLVSRSATKTNIVFPNETLLRDWLGINWQWAIAFASFFFSTGPTFPSPVIILAQKFSLATGCGFTCRPGAKPRSTQASLVLFPMATRWHLDTAGELSASQGSLPCAGHMGQKPPAAPKGLPMALWGSATPACRHPAAPQADSYKHINKFSSL